VKSTRTPALDVALTAELLTRHDRPAPRYTSYPTAVEFTPEVDAGVYGELLEEADRAAGEPISIYVHLPFCERRCHFCGCNVIVSPKRQWANRYLGLLVREAEMLAERLPNRRSLSQLHLGGGTPTYHTPAELESFLGAVLALFPAEPGADLAVEVDPRVTTEAHLDTLRAHGFTRISLGVQDLDAGVQERIGREQALEEIAALVQASRARGFDTVNADLIYGLPLQKPESFGQTVDAVAGMGVDRFAIYSFAHLPDALPHQKKIDPAELPGRDTKVMLYATARDRLLRAGYEAIGMDHFVLPTDELALARGRGELRRSFQGYTTIPATALLGLGVSSIGDLAHAHAQNTKKLSEYEETIEAGRLATVRGVRRTPDDEVRLAVIHGLMCNGFVDVQAIERAHDVEFATYFSEDLEALRKHEAEGLVEISADRLTATPAGELLVRNLALCFDAYRRAAASRKGFSRAI
jgi:oxygen-independent coproporphyrinogen-3 oxidase